MFRMTPGFDVKVKFKTPIYRTVDVKVSPKQKARIEVKAKEGYCKIHIKNKVRSGDGKCGTCLSRIRKCLELGLINEKTPADVLDKILRLPDQRGKGKSLARGVRDFLDRENLR